MKRLFLVLMLFSVSAFGATPFEQGETAGTRSPSDIDTYETANMAALSRLVANFKSGAKISYLSAATLTVGIGEVVVSNSDGSDREFLQNTVATTVSWANIDTGTESSSKTYYVYAYGSSAADTFSVLISESTTTPTGQTQYLKLGSFYNDSSGNITRITNDGFYSELGTWTSRSSGTIYQATTDGFVSGYNSTGNGILMYTDSNSSPTTVRVRNGDGSDDSGGTMPVKAGDYWKVTNATNVFWISYD